MGEGEEFIASLDVGTTTVRCFIFDKMGNNRGESKTNSTEAGVIPPKALCCIKNTRSSGGSDHFHYTHYKVNIYFPEHGHVEIRPNELWQACVNVIKDAVYDSGSNFKSIKGLGISCQRNSFITWKRSTGQPYHNIITWKDLRANDIVNEINRCMKLKVFNLVSKVLYTFTWSKRFLAGSILKMTNNQITPRLIWVLRNIPGILEDLKVNDVAFGTIDTWLLNKLTDGVLHITDVSNASSTGLYDPFTLSWAKWAFQMFNIPRQIFPEVVDNAGLHFGCVSEKIFGEPITIYCCMADQSASMFGFCCFHTGDIKVTMGTGTFLDVNTGNKPHASFYGLYPLVGWKYQNELIYIAEGAANDTGILIQYAQDLDFITNPSDCTQIAESVKDNSGVYFVPAFNGLQAPINDATAAAGFIGLKSTTRKPHLLRAILESIVFRIIQLFTILRKEVNLTPSYIRVDGGVSNCDFVIQMLADINSTPVLRPVFTEMSAMGAAYLTGLIAGIWKNKEELLSIKKECQVFYPKHNEGFYREEYLLWSNAVKRFLNWYS